MIHGLLKIDKEEGFSSQDIDTIIKKKFSMKKVGHLGTLDPFATGLLIIGLGDGTKAFPYIDDFDKEYIASLRLFSKTETLDKTSPITENMDKKCISLSDIEKAFSSLKGVRKQIPPIYSAKHVDGKRAYDLARAGKKVTLDSIEVNIKELELISFDENESLLSFRALVSKGTYIRSLGLEIANGLGTFGYLESLRRTKIGSITLENSIKAQDVEEKDVLPLIDLLLQYPQVEVRGKLKQMVYDGAPLYLDDHQEEYIAMVSDHVLMAIYKKDTSKYYCMKGFHYGS